MSSIYFFKIRPFEEKILNLLQGIDEVGMFCIVSIYASWAFDPAFDIELKNVIGWGVNGIVSFLIFKSLVVIVYEIGGDLIGKC